MKLYHKQKLFMQQIIILYYFIIGKNLTKIKWFSLGLLFFAGIFYSFANIKSGEEFSINEICAQDGMRLIRMATDFLSWVIKLSTIEFPNSLRPGFLETA